MKKKLYREIDIPEDTQVSLDGNRLSITGPQGVNTREFRLGKVSLEIKNNKIIIGHEKATKNEKKIINTTNAHIKNMIRGVRKQFEYKLKICFSHFPITVEITHNEAKIKNFLGEKVPRVMKIPKGVEVKANKEIVEISSCDKEIAGKVAADFEKTTKIRNRDRRVFQDGLYIIEKDGREI